MVSSTARLSSPNKGFPCSIRQFAQALQACAVHGGIPVRFNLPQLGRQRNRMHPDNWLQPIPVPQLFSAMKYKCAPKYTVCTWFQVTLTELYINLRSMVEYTTSHDIPRECLETRRSDWWAVTAAAAIWPNDHPRRGCLEFQLTSTIPFTSIYNKS